MGKELKSPLEKRTKKVAQKVKESTQKGKKKIDEAQKLPLERKLKE